MPYGKRIVHVVILCLIGLTGCLKPSVSPGAQSPKMNSGLISSQMEKFTTESSPLPTNLPPTPTPQPIHLVATVWEKIPQVPILMYHRFNPRIGAPSEKYKTSLEDFDNQLNALFEAGFSLVPLSDWVKGVVHLPEGRRPLIITIDDLFYADQISLDDSGQPAPYSGVGRLWQFSKAHPEFNFHVALFFNLGDKPYANYYAEGVFSLEGNWRQDQAQAIAWGIENNAIPFNHLYDHPILSNLSPEEIHHQLEQNDLALRDSLASIGKEYLADALPNIIALPYVVWPATQEGKQVLFDYTTPEGAPVSAILEANEPSGAKFCLSPFDPAFSRWHVPRINATWEAIKFIVEGYAEVPAAHLCHLGEFPAGALTQPNLISQAISLLVNDQVCPAGYYIVDRLAFYIDADEAIQLSP